MLREILICTIINELSIVVKVISQKPQNILQNNRWIVQLEISRMYFILNTFSFHCINHISIKLNEVLLFYRVTFITQDAATSTE